MTGFGTGHLRARQRDVSVKKAWDAIDQMLVIPRSVTLLENPAGAPTVKERVRSGLSNADSKQIPPGSASHTGSEEPEPRTASDEALVVEKKKKKFKKDGDKIDNIFG
ncbi:hypothetical protein B0A53_02125 [Rhodotorula sp. CCFEE 5036]|jgi:hypothetical protein|nr:hypothetical protein B0A53_02125 [Rhodotorula sp. CCFEE 5036]